MQALTPLIGKEDMAEIERLLRAGLAGEVKVALFTSQAGCPYCPETRQLLEEVASVSDKVVLEVLDREKDGARAKAMAVEFSPTTVIVSSNGAMLHYVGMPAGRQLRSLVEDLVDASRGRTEMDKETRDTIASVSSPTVIKVFVTPVCPYSPLVVRSAHRFAIENPMVSAFMIETVEFPDIAGEYGVVGVPRTVINERVRFDGAPEERAFARKVLEASKQGSA